MHAYLINEEQGSIVGKFDSVKSAEELKKRAAFKAAVITERSESLSEFSTGTLTSLYNSVTPEDRKVKQFKTKALAIKRLVRALHETNYKERLVTPKSTRTRDIEPGKLTDKIVPVRRQSRIGKLIKALHEGGTLEELAEAIDYPASKLWRDHGYSLQRKGYGREQRDGKFFLVMPEGMTEPLLR